MAQRDCSPTDAIVLIVNDQVAAKREPFDEIAIPGP